MTSIVSYKLLILYAYFDMCQDQIFRGFNTDKRGVSMTFWDLYPYRYYRIYSLSHALLEVTIASATLQSSFGLSDHFLLIPEPSFSMSPVT